MSLKSLRLRVRFPANPVSNLGNLATGVSQDSMQHDGAAKETKKLHVGGSASNSEAELHATALTASEKDINVVVSDEAHQGGTHTLENASDDQVKVKQKKTKRSSTLCDDTPQQGRRKPATVIVAPPSPSSFERKLKPRRESVSVPLLELENTNSVYGSFSFDIFQGDSEDYHDKQDIFQRNLLTLAEKSSHPPDPNRTKIDPTISGITTPSQLRKVVFLNRTISTIDPENLNARLVLNNRHLEMWDTEDDAFYACTAELHLVCDDFSQFDILGRTKSSDTYAVSYTGHTFTNASEMVPDYGIQIEPQWHPTIYQVRERMWGWYIKFCIPIPVQLFTKMETRTFRVLARIAIGSTEKYKVLHAYDDMSVSHLRREREMI